MTTIDRDAVLAELDERLRIVRGALNGAVTEDAIRISSAVRLALELTRDNLAVLPNNDEVERLRSGLKKIAEGKRLEFDAEEGVEVEVWMDEDEMMAVARALIQPNS